MKTDFDQFKHAVTGTGEAVEEATEAVAEGDHSVQSGTTIDDIVDDEIREIIVDNVRTSLRQTFESNAEETNSPNYGEALKEGLKTIQEPEVKRMLAELWYGQKNIETNPPKPQLGNGRDSATDNQPKPDGTMITEKQTEETGSIDYQPKPDEIHNVLNEFISFYSNEYPKKTAREIFVDINVIFAMANHAAQQEPETQARRMKELLDKNPEIFESQIEQFIDQMEF